MALPWPHDINKMSQSLNKIEKGMSQITIPYVIKMKMNLKEFTIKIIPMRQEVLEQARRLTGDDNDAEDLAQEVMLKLWTMRESIDTHPNVKALAFTILHNKHGYVATPTEDFSGGRLADRYRKRKC